MITRRTFLQSSAAAAAFAAAPDGPRRNAPGVTDTEIKIGQTMPYSGPASAYGVIGRTEAAYFKMINDQGGVNGRKINLIRSTTATARRRRWSRRAVWSSRSRSPSCSTRSAPRPTPRSGISQPQQGPATVRRDRRRRFPIPAFPLDDGLQPNYQTEARIFAKHILATKPDAKVAVLYQNDGFGKDYLIGLKDGLGADHAGMVVKEASYETSEPTVDSQIVTLQGSGADVLLIAATPKFAAQAIRKSSDLGWNAPATSPMSRSRFPR